MTLYFITRNGDEKGLIKIGHASNVTARLSSLSAGAPEGFKTLAVAEGGYVEEQAIHEHLHGDRYGGEWFWPTEAVLEVVASAKAGTLKQIPIVADRVGVVVALPHYKDLTVDTPVTQVAASALNELVHREHRGQGDTMTAARDRLADALGQPRTLLATLWSRWRTRPDVSGNLLQALLVRLADAAEADGTLTPLLLMWTSKQQAEINARLFGEEGNP